MKDSVLVDQVVLDSSSSPPLTSSLHSRNSASSAQESAYLRHAALCRWFRLCLSVLATAIALSIVGCVGHVLHTYNQTHLAPEWYLPLWPVNVDLKPTLGTILPAAMVVLGSVGYVVFAVVPSPHSRTRSQVLFFTFTSLMGVVAALFAVLFDQLLTNLFDVDDRHTLQTWTCMFYNGAKAFERDANNLNIPVSGDPLIPAGFGRLCMENKAGQWMMVGLFVVQLACCGVAVWGFLVEKKIQRSRRMRYRDVKCESEVE